MIKIYNENYEYVTSIANECQLSDFVFDHEFDYKYILVKENGITKIFDVGDASYVVTKAKILKYSRFFQMEKICALSNVDYDEYKCWKNGGQELSKDEMNRIRHTIYDIGQLTLDVAEKEIEAEWEKKINE